MKTLPKILLLGGSASFTFGGVIGVPEVDGATAASAIALAAGSLMILRSRLRK